MCSSTPGEIWGELRLAEWDGDVARFRTYLSSYAVSYLAGAGRSDGYNLLSYALENCHATIAEVLLDAGACVNVESGIPMYRDTPLHWAARRGFKDIVERLLSMGANVDAQGDYGTTPLQGAARQNNDEIVKLLLRHGASVNASRDNGATALYMSVYNGTLSITEILLNHGASLFCTVRGGLYDKYTPLHVAGKWGFEDISKLLLSKGANVNAMSKNHGTPLHIAIDKEHLNLVTLFLQNGADTNATNHNGDTCLHFAARKGSVENCKALLDKGSSVDVTNSLGVTPAFLALKKRRTGIVRLLLERGADVNFQDKYGKTILCIAVEERSETFVDLILKFSPDVNNEQNKRAIKIAALDWGDRPGKIIDRLLQYGFKANLKVDDAKDVEVLHAAVEKGYFKLVENMLKSCQDVVPLINATDSKGRTSLHVASEKKREDIVKLLISLGADVNALTACTRLSIKSRTPLFYSVKNNDINISKILLKNQAEANGCLLMAVQKQNLEMVELLLLHGADPNTKDDIESDLIYGRSRNHFREKADSDYMLRKGRMDVKGENLSVEPVQKSAIGTKITKIVDILVKYGADVNEAAGVDTDKIGPVLRTPLMVAVATGNTDITTMLLDKGAAVNVALMPEEITALHMAVYLKRSNLVDVLLRRQPDIDLDCKDCEKRSPLHYYVDHGDAEIALTLLKRGADVNCKDHLGKTPLHYAVEESDRAEPVLATYDGVDIVEALLRSGADPNARDTVHGYTPLHHWAANKKSQGKIVDSLLKYGADIDSRSKTEETPLFVAVKNRCQSSVSALLTYGADVNIQHFKIKEDGQGFEWSSALQEARWLESTYGTIGGIQYKFIKYFTITALLCHHMIMLDSAKFYVNATDMHSLDSCGVALLNKYRKKCEEELSLLKLTKVVGNPKVSFYDFLTKSPNKLASLLKRENIVEIISSEQFRKDLGSFVIYGDLINNRIEIALRRGNVLKTASSCIGKMFSIPDLCIDSISDYLTTFDLNNFVEACKESDC